VRIAEKVFRVRGQGHYVYKCTSCYDGGHIHFDSMASRLACFVYYFYAVLIYFLDQCLLSCYFDDWCSCCFQCV